MILNASDTAAPHFFLQGFRAPIGGLGSTAVRVGTLVIKMVVRFDGTLDTAEPVLLVDKSFFADEVTEPLREEAEIAPFKANLDVSIVDDMPNIVFIPPIDITDPEAVIGALPLTVFGTVRIDRGLGFGVAHPRSFGWRTRLSGPRLGEAGRLAAPPADEAHLDDFNPELFDLPDQFDNSFFNGAPITTETPLAPGDSIQFVDSAGPINTLVIPPAPIVSVTEFEQPLIPPLSLTPLVDTVLFDRSVDRFTLVWRESFAWEERFESATLGIL